MDEPRVCVVVLNWNGEADTLACLQCLRGQDYTNHRVILIDNGSSDGSAARLKTKAPECDLVVLPKNLGFAGGCNVGIDRALAEGADYILLLNNDTLAAPGMLREMVAAAQAHPEAGAVAPKICYAHDRSRIWSAGARRVRFPPRVVMVGLGQKDGLAYDRAGELDCATACALLVRAGVFGRVGRLDPSYFFYHEDYDFTLRLREAGYRIRYAPAAIVWHKASASLTEGSPEKWRLWARGAVRFYARHYRFPASALGTFTIWFILREIVKGNGRLVKPYLQGLTEEVFKKRPEETLT